MGTVGVLLLAVHQHLLYDHWRKVGISADFRRIDIHQTVMRWKPEGAVLRLACGRLRAESAFSRGESITFVVTTTKYRGQGAGSEIIEVLLADTHKART